MLTVRQKDCLGIIAKRISDDGIAPSFHEMRGALGLSSLNSVHRLVDGLEERGMIRRIRDRARAIEVSPAGWAYLQARISYFRFDDESKTFVPWRAPVARKTA